MPPSCLPLLRRAKLRGLRRENNKNHNNLANPFRHGCPASYPHDHGTEAISLYTIQPLSPRFHWECEAEFC